MATGGPWLGGPGRLRILSLLGRHGAQTASAAQRRLKPFDPAEQRRDRRIDLRGRRLDQHKLELDPRLGAVGGRVECAGDEVEQADRTGLGQRLACSARRRSRSGVTRSSRGTSPSTWTASSSRPWTSRSRNSWPGSRPDSASLAAARREPAGSRGDYRLDRLEQLLGIGHAEDREHIGRLDRLIAGIGDELLERAERIAEAPGRMAGDQRHRPVIDVDLFLVGNAAQHGRDLLDGGPPEVEAVAAIDDRRQDLLSLGRGEDENRPGRGLLERLQERVPRLRGKHVRLVEDVDLVAAGDGRVGDLLPQVADVVDRVVRRGVHLDHVERARGRDRDARLAYAARLGRRAVHAVQTGGEDLGHARLPRPAGADEQVGMMDLALLDRVLERAHDVLLADDVGERPGAVAAVQGRAGRHGSGRV